jgi:phage-related tail fiber protein
MANTIRIRRSATASAVPTTGQLALGELAVNTFDGKLYLKRDNGTQSIVEVGATASFSPDEAFKSEVAAATTANITLSGTQTIDGIALVAGNRALVKAQTTASANGIYVVAAGAWARATDADTSAELAGATVVVANGTVNGSQLYRTSFKPSDTLGTTAMTWGQVVSTLDSGTVTSTMIADDTIVNADINSAAAIADTKLATISTAGKVSGSAITSGTIAGTTIFNTSGAITTTAAITDSHGNVRDIVQNSQTAAYTLVIADNGKHISITTGGVTVPSAVFSAGDVISIFNNSASNQTVTQGASVTMYLAGTATTGNRTLAQRGICTVLCVASNTFVISGAGLT